MNRLIDRADEIPVTMSIVIAYVTLAFLTNPFAPSGEALLKFGALEPFLVANGEAWRLLAAAFLHGGIVHLGVNLLSLVQIGPVLERSLGSVRFAILYLVAAVGGNVAVCLWYDPFGMVVGGSGALFGMLGALLAMQMRGGAHALSFVEHAGTRQLIGLIVANLAIGWLVPFISNTAHVGGLASGFLVTTAWPVPPRHAGRTPWAMRAALTALLAGGLFASVLPVTRYEWLWNQGVASPSPERRAALQRAAAMSYFGKGTADDAMVERFVREVLPADDDERGGEPPRAPRGR